MKKTKLITALALGSFLFVSCSTPEYTATDNTAAGNIDFTDYTSYSIAPASVGDDFMRGVDASEVKALEELGIKFYDENNCPKDIFEIFSSYGVNYVRLRLWNDYKVALEDTAWGPYGYNNLKRTVSMAKRAKRYGMKVFLDFHYSDSWADPVKQYIPESFKNFVEDENGTPYSEEDIDITGLSEAVKNYTADVIKAMKEQGCEPSMVQLGNEMQGGLFRRTRTNAVAVDGSDGNTTNLSFDHQVKILRESALAIRELLPDCVIMLHQSNGGNTSYTNAIINYANSIGNDANGKKLIDAAGFSYYTFYTNQGTDKDLKSNMERAKNAGLKPVIVENSYAYSDEAWMDSTKNDCYQQGELTASYLKLYSTRIKSIDASIENQALVMRHLMHLANDVDSTGGYFYWGAAYLGVDNGMSSSWENQALFDVNGKVLPSLNVYKSNK